MSMKAAIHGFSAWSNVRLSSSGCPCESILKDIMEGERMRVLLQKIAGSVPNRLQSLDGLSAAQKVMRVDWFVDALKSSGKLPRQMKIDSKMFSMQSTDHVFPLLWHLVCSDIALLWEAGPMFQRPSRLNSLLAEPFKLGPNDGMISSDKIEPFYLTSSGSSIAHSLKRRHRQHMEPADCLIDLVNQQIKQTTDGRKLHIEDLEDIIDSRVLCSLVNSLVPGTFTSEVLLNDRWTINLALQIASHIFQVNSPVDSGDIYENDEMGMCAFLAYFFMAGYQFCQAEAVVKKIAELRKKCEDAERELQGDPPPKQKKQLKSRLESLRKEKGWLTSVYCYEQCVSWVEHARRIQQQAREKIASKMRERFDVITVTRPMTINKLIEGLVINLSLTGGNGFYYSDSKESVSTSRRLVVRDKRTGDFYEDFSGTENKKGSVREMLGLHPLEVVTVNPSQYPDYEVFFESTSRNKTLCAGTRFLYQVFPGTTSQCQRLLLRAARVGEVSTVSKLVLFFKSDKEFVNSRDQGTGNTALHLASRHGHFDTALLLLENGAEVNAQNSAGCSPFFLSTEGLHKQLSLLLLEWGADIHIKNKVSKTALELTRNTDLREFLERRYAEYRELVLRITGGDVKSLEERLHAHTCGRDVMASLQSRCIRGNTLFHAAAFLGSQSGVEVLLGQHVEVNLLNSNGATPLHLCRDPAIIAVLLEHGADVSATDNGGNTPLHLVCSETKTSHAVSDCIALLISKGDCLDVENNEGHLALHCAASHGLIAALEAILSSTEGSIVGERLRDQEEAAEEGAVSSLIHLALLGNHLDTAQWLANHGFLMSYQEASKIALRILQGPPQGCTQPVEILQFILQLGVFDVNTAYSSGNRPLHLAAALVRVAETVDLLLEAGAEVDARNDEKATPLFIACRENNPYAASRLLIRGADHTAVDISGRAAFDYITEPDDWIGSGYFSEEVQARLKSFSLKQAKDLIKTMSVVVKLPPKLQS